MTADINSPDTEALINLFTNAMREKFKALELENEALKMRLNEARLKLELAKSKLEEGGADASFLGLDSNL